ncbi:conserved hypothetical protein [Tenacibaculum maritimum]|uniref:hypothetical protein n=1 Tax=Tenacibaculum maritimum TaxID=107401 RepID=UPI0012E48DB7|nr:hypothetical protein [Tenacibaculum maritimum]CAA0252567.1 conserved hypothetical protein [Tenacibaculum maritimum]
MANKKIWAYGKNFQNEYIKDSLDRNRMFFIWEALSLKKNKPDEYNSITFWSTQRNENERSKMTTVKLGFFRYIENIKGNTYSGDGESLSHSIAILALSRLKELNFTIGNKKLSIEPKEIIVDDLKVQFENGNYYFPDLICRFDKPLYITEKWGNKLAIEVKVSHACESIKVKDFEDHNYPIIEITLNKNMQFLKELRKETFDEDDLKKYYDFLTEKFSKNIYGKIISDPVRVKYHKRKIKELSSEITNLTQQSTKLKKSYSETKRDSLYKVESLTNNISKLEKERNKLEQENNQLKNKSFITKLFELFKNSS